MNTSSALPYMDGLFMPVIPVSQSNSGSVRKVLFILPEEALQVGMQVLSLLHIISSNQMFLTYFYFSLFIIQLSQNSDPNR